MSHNAAILFVLKDSVSKLTKSGYRSFYSYYQYRLFVQAQDLISQGV
jgi:hypothetical protein